MPDKDLYLTEGVAQKQCADSTVSLLKTLTLNYVGWFKIQWAD